MDSTNNDGAGDGRVHRQHLVQLADVQIQSECGSGDAGQLVPGFLRIHRAHEHCLQHIQSHRMRRLYYGLLLTLASQILNTRVSHLVHFSICFPYFHEIADTASTPLLDSRCLSANARMDMLY